MKTINTKLGNDSTLDLIAILIIVIAYAAEKILELIVTPSHTLALVLAMVYTILLAVVTLILSKSENIFSGMMAALIGYKMMPVSINFLPEMSMDGNILYYIVCKVAVIIFLVLAFRLYNMQENPKSIKALPIIAIIYAVPFFNEIGATLMDYFLDKTGSMLGGYLSQYACYTAASMIILALAFVSNYASMRFAAYFELTALGINILRNVGKISVKLHYGQHISKSLYGWIILYIVILICFFIAKSVKKKGIYNI